MSSTAEVLGRTLTFPIEVRKASSWAAQFVVDVAAAQRIVQPASLTAFRVLPGKALVSIVFVRYEDSDLDAYNEVGIGVLVRDGTRRAPAVYIHHLPVDQTFTLHAGRELWGYPKFLASIDISERDGVAECVLDHDGRRVLTLSVREGGYLPLPSKAPPTYTFDDGTLRRTEWAMPRVRVRARFGGATLRLGAHPIAEELRALGLPKRALMTQSIPAMRACFGSARVV